MGRGRQKAKQIKVARDLKYYSPPTDLSALQRELQAKESAEADDDDWETDDDSWAPSDEPSDSTRR